VVGVRASVCVRRENGWHFSILRFFFFFFFVDGRFFFGFFFFVCFFSAIHTPSARLQVREPLRDLVRGEVFIGIVVAIVGGIRIGVGCRLAYGHT
jgi:uncharacterized membrane protein YedE/YeeE